MTKINRIDIVILLLIGAIVYQQITIRSIKIDFNKQLKVQIDSIDLQLKTLAKKDLVISAKLQKAKKTDSIIDKKIDDKVKVLKWKIHKNEKITNSIIDALKRDSIRAILKAN